jgi:hypothetical protein
MTRYAPQSQTHAVMREKREIAQRLLAGGLTIKQISLQLRCSRYFVQQARDWSLVPEAPPLHSTDTVCMPIPSATYEVPL